METEDLVLKKAVFEDWKPLYRNMTSKSESSRYMLWKADETEAMAMERMSRTIEFERREKYAFLVYLKSTGEAIGFAAMREVEPGIFEEMGIAIGPEYVRKGYGNQILQVFCEEAKKCGATSFRASYRIGNTAPAKLLETCGFVFDYDSVERTDPRNGEKYVVRNVCKRLSAK